MTDDQLREAAKNLAEKYPKDIDSATFEEELIQFKYFFSAIDNESIPGATSAHQLLNIIRSKKLSSSFPNTEISLNMYVCMMVSNSSGERSFSFFHRLKDFLRNCIRDELTSKSAMLSINQDLLLNLLFDDLINDFANVKVRRVCL